VGLAGAQALALAGAQALAMAGALALTLIVSSVAALHQPTFYDASPGYCISCHSPSFLELLH